MLKDRCGNDICPWCGSHSNFCAQPGEAGDPCWDNFCRAARVQFALSPDHKPEYVDMSDDKIHLESTSDARIENNTMRHKYRVLNEDEKKKMEWFKDAGLLFVETCDREGSSRELSLAKTKMEEAVMWAVKHITR